MSQVNPGECELCAKDVNERCNDLVCRNCHKSLSFEECVSGEWTRKMRGQAGFLVEEST